MKVVLVWNGPVNVAERTILLRREISLIRELMANGVQPTVVLLGDRAGTSQELAAAGIPVRVVSTSLPPGAIALARLPAAVWKLRPILRELGAAIMEGTEPMPAIALGLAALRSHRDGVVLYRRQHAGGRRRLNVASRVAARLAQRTIVSSEAMRRQAVLHDRTPFNQVDLARTGAPDIRHVSPETLAAIRRELGIAESARVISVVSRFRHEKGIDVLLRAVELLHSVPDLHVVLAGTGPEEAALREIGARVAVPVHFVGHRDDVEVWYALADVVAIPSRRESFSRVVLEAMAAGRPLVAARVGGLVEAVVDGESGLLVPPDDPAALASALMAILDDRSFAARLGAAARQRFETSHTIAHMAGARRAAWERSLAATRPKASR